MAAGRGRLRERKNNGFRLKKMACLLCEKDKKLCDSHIIPEFMYKPLYDDKHKFHQLSNFMDKNHEYLQKGLREKLLCRECELHISKFEDYAAKFFQGGTELRVTNFQDGIVVNQVDYTKFKLFQMSILWRMGVSSSPVFKKVSLGEKHENRLRKMILDENPGNPTDYGVLYSLIYEDSKLLNELIIPPGSFRYKGYRMYRLVVGGLLWGFVVSSHSGNFLAADDFLNETGRLFLYKTERRNLGFITEMAKKLYPYTKNVMK